MNQLMRKLIMVLILLTVIASCTSGCYDQREVDEMAYVMAMGFDKGTTEKLRLTLQIITFRNQEGGEQGGRQRGGQGGGQTDQITVECSALFDGINLANTILSRQINLMHAKHIVISEELARNGDVEKYISAVIRYRQIRRIMNFIVTKGKAEDFLKENQPFIGNDPPKDMQLLKKQSAYTSYIPEVKLFDFYNNVKSTMIDPIAILAGVNPEGNLAAGNLTEESLQSGQYLAGKIPREGGTKKEYFGAAVFRGAKMVGEIDGNGVKMYKMVHGLFERGYFIINDPLAPDYVISLDVRQSRKPSIEVKVTGNEPKINVEIFLEGEILAIQSRINYEDPKQSHILETTFEKIIKEHLDSLIKTCQQDFKADIFGFGRYAAFSFPTIESWEEYNWKEKFPEGKVSTKVNFVIRRTGMITKSSPIVPPIGDVQ
ncbi:MAG: spore germination protein [Clostridia bacterium]|nr:spore germination protein [Clostridia bacterium]